MSARDRRVVGDLLATATPWLERRYLYMSADQAQVMVRTWSRVLVLAARLWLVLPPAPLTTPSEPGRIFDQAVKPPGTARSGIRLVNSRRCDERALDFVQHWQIDNRAETVIVRRRLGLRPGRNRGRDPMSGAVALSRGGDIKINGMTT